MSPLDMVGSACLRCGSVLLCPKLRVVGAGIGDELAVGSLLNDLSSRQHQNLVGIDDSREAVRNEYGRPVFGYLANGIQNGLGKQR